MAAAPPVKHMGRSIFGLASMLLAVSVALAAHISAVLASKQGSQDNSHLTISLTSPFEVISEAPWMIFSYIFLIISDMFYLVGCVVKKFGLMGPIVDLGLLYFLISYGGLALDALGRSTGPAIARTRSYFDSGVGTISHNLPFVSQTPPVRRQKIVGELGQDAPLRPLSSSATGSIIHLNQQPSGPAASDNSDNDERQPVAETPPRSTVYQDQ